MCCITKMVATNSNTQLAKIVELLYTLLGNIMTGLFTTGKIMVRGKYGGFFKNPPHYPGRKFTCDQPFNIF